MAALKINICTVLILFFAINTLFADDTGNQNDAVMLSEEDIETIQNLELLKNLEILEKVQDEDLELLENLEIIESMSEEESQKLGAENEYAQKN